MSTVTLMGLTTAEMTLLTGAGVGNDNDLTMLTRENIDTVLATSSLVVRGRVFKIAQYIESGAVVTTETTLETVNARISTNRSPTSVLPGSFFTDSMRGAPKMHVDGLTEFIGTPVKWEDWNIGTSSTLGQTVYSTLLSTPAPAGDLQAKNRDRELYFMLKKALYQGSAYHIVEGQAETESGHLVWQDLLTWYGSDAVSRTIIDHYMNKITSLRLSQSGEANDYINNFIMCSTKLEEKGEGYTPKTKLTKFLDGIIDEDYDVAVQNLRSDSAMTFKDAVERIRQREQELLRLTREATTKARRTKGKDATGNSSKIYNKHAKAIPSLPDWILKSADSKTRRSLIKWRGVYNAEGRHLRANEITDAEDKGESKKDSKKRSSDDGSVGSSTNRRSEKTKKKGRQSRRTKTTIAGLGDGSTPRVHLKSEDEYDDSDSEDSEYDSDSKPKAKKSNTPKSKTMKGAKKNRRNPAPLDGREEEDTPRIVLDEGTEFEVIGGAGWKVLDKLSKSANMGGWRAGMNGPTLPIVNAVTAFDSASTGKTILLGLGATAWDDRSEQTEALVNTHAMRKNNVVVHNVSKRDGGLQRLEVGGQVIELDFTDAEKLLTLKIREPTDTELRDLTINWLTPRIPVDASELLKQSSRRRRGHVKPELTIEWNDASRMHLR
jgi:hypothetical protein